MFKITIEKNTFKNQVAWLNSFESVVKDPRVMDIGVKFIGRELNNQFRSEGSHASHKWAELAPATQKLRRRRGYPPAHPILVQSGQLKDMTAGAFSRWTVGQGDYVKSDGLRTSIVASTRPLEFYAHIFGPKVANHWGGMVEVRGNKGRLPQRRFFGITSIAAEKAAEAINDKIMTDWARKSGLVKRIY